MNNFARTLRAEPKEIISITPPFSIYDYIDSKFSGFPSLHRIISQVRENGGKTIVVEHVSDAVDIVEEEEDIQIIHPNFKNIEVKRLGFFKTSFSKQATIKRLSSKEFLGYAIIKKYNIPGKKEYSIHESIVVSSRHDNNYIRKMPIWRCRIANSLFRIRGYMYAQQNNITNVCAHVALRTVVSFYHKDGDMMYREMNRVIGVDHKNRKFGPDSGLDVGEMTEIIHAAGANTYVGDYTLEESKIVPFHHYIYGSIESGYPAIIIFKVKNDNGEGYHAIPVFGHTFNNDLWVSRANLYYFKIGTDTAYVPSDSWLSSFIAHDDNFGSNFCIPKTYLHTRHHSVPTLCQKEDEKKKKVSDSNIESECVAYIIGTLPRTVSVRSLSYLQF